MASIELKRDCVNFATGTGFMKLFKLEACPWTSSGGNLKIRTVPEMLRYCDFQTGVPLASTMKFTKI
jgi:hypothetical protein